MTRIPHWESALTRHLDGCWQRRFAWGEWDCALMAADVASLLTGQDYAGEWRGRYRTALGARRVLKKEGGIEAAFTARLGDPVSPRVLRRGDIALMPALVEGWDLMVGVVAGEKVALPCEPVGLLYRPVSLALKGWVV